MAQKEPRMGFLVLVFFSFKSTSFEGLGKALPVGWMPCPVSPNVLSLGTSIFCLVLKMIQITVTLDVRLCFEI